MTVGASSTSWALGSEPATILFQDCRVHQSNLLGSAEVDVNKGSAA